MPTKTYDVDNLLQLLAALNLKSAQVTLRNRASVGHVINALKELYGDDGFEKLIYGNGRNPFLALLDKGDE